MIGVRRGIDRPPILGPRLGLAQHTPNLLIRVTLLFHGKIPLLPSGSFCQKNHLHTGSTLGRRPMVGDRDVGYATEFMRDLVLRLATRVQLTTDGHRAYLEAVEDAFGNSIDYAQLVKLYGESSEPGPER